MSPEQIEQFRALFGMLQQRDAVAGHAPEDIAGQQLAMSGAPAALDAIREIDRKQRQAAIQELWEMTPPGSAMAAADAYGRGDLPGVLFGALGAVPGAGVAGQAGKGIVKATKAMRSAWKAAGVADDLPVDAASRIRRMADQGYERGWWRGGDGPDSGYWFSRHPEVAAGHANKRPGGGDMREYALAPRNAFDYDAVYGPDTLMAAAGAVEPYNPSAAAGFRDMAAAGEHHHGGGLYLMLRRHSNGVESTLADMGYDAVRHSGGALQTLGRGIVRDANRAAFDPRLKGVPNPFAGLLPFGLGGGAMLGYGSSLSDRERPTW